MSLHTLFLQKGGSRIMLLFIISFVVSFGFLLGGGLYKTKQTTLTTASQLPSENGLRCCDSGSGEACQPISSKVFSYKGDTYELLKSNTTIYETYKHFGATNERFEGNMIYENTNDSPDNINYHAACGIDGPDNTKDRLQVYYTTSDNRMARRCEYINDNLLMYVCKESDEKCAEALTEEGEGNLVFNVYIRTNKNEGIPNGIKNCREAQAIALLTATPIPAPSMKLSAKSAKNNLQIDTFTPSQAGVDRALWLSPWCKPAIYLYPETTMPISVKVAPIGPMTLTIPKYPANGWSVVASSDGMLQTNEGMFDYLYYEAQIPDSKIVLPDTGYIKEAKDLTTFLQALLTKLGLHENEKKEFMKYWIGVLPKSAYYAIRVLPQETSDRLAPLIIMPRPQSVLRVNLHFTPLDQRIVLQEPTITPFVRTGFTVVEWGGIYKRDKTHNFSCLL